MARADVALAALTRSEAGSVILRGGETVVVAAEPTAGGGHDRRRRRLCGGVSGGIDTAGRPLAACGRMGSIAAAEVISHYGARPETDLKKLVAGL